MLVYYSSDDEYANDEGLYDDDNMSDEWKFLFHWFEIIAHRLSLADAKRSDTNASDLGRDQATDWWIDVDHEIGFLVSRYDELDDDREIRYRTVRESLILLTMMAHVDYDEWLDELRASTRFVPTKWANLHHEDLARKFLFRLQDNDRNPALFGWSLLQDLFGTENYSEQFRADFARACSILTARGVDVATMEPIPIRLQLDPPEYFSRTQQVTVLKNLAKTVTKILDTEDKYHKAAAKRKPTATPLPPVFRLESVTLDCRDFMFHSTVLKEIQAIVEIGVPIESLTLPKRYCSRSKEADGVLRSAWAGLLCAITGQPQLPSKKKATHTRPVCVRRIVMPGLPPSQVWLIPLLSAVATSTHVLALRFEQRVYERLHEEKQWRLWAWMGYSLFRSGAQTSVKALELSGLRLAQDEVDALAKITSAASGEDALGLLWRLSSISDMSEIRQSTGVACTTRAITLPKGTIVTSFGYDLNFYLDTLVVTLPCDWSGTLLLGDEYASSDTTVDVLLPGFGFCRVDRDKIPNKRPKLTPREPTTKAAARRLDITPTLVPISTLVLGLRPKRSGTMAYRRITGTVNDTIEAKPFVPQVLQLVGQSLTALSLFADDVDDACLDKSLAHCPRLRCLRLHGLKLSTADPLIRAYGERQMQIASLELRDIQQLPVDEFEKFLRYLEPLGAANPIRTHLRKLRFGKGWGLGFRQETVQLMTRILDSDDCRLSYVHTHNSLEGDPEMRRAWRLREFRGPTLTGGPLEAASRRAFLSVVRVNGSTANRSARTLLSQDTLAKILEFAAKPTSRVVVDDYDMGRRDYFLSDDEDD